MPSKPLHLADLDPKRVADEVVSAVHARARRDARALGLYVKQGQVPAGVDPQAHLDATLKQSKLWKTVWTCAAWAAVGKGKPEEVDVALQELRAILAGTALGEPVPREVRALTAAIEVVATAAGARLALALGRTVDAVELAALAGLDERSIREAAKTGRLSPVGNGRPMRFEAALVCRYLYERGVPGFEVASGGRIQAPAQVPAAR
jgi:hypothetical protein